VSLADTLVVIVVIGIAIAFLHWIYEHVVRFFTVGSWRRCPECDRVILREAKSCERCGTDLRAPAPRAG
jgi:rRNA maturation endonuclease Nob1